MTPVTRALMVAVAAACAVAACAGQPAVTEPGSDGGTGGSATGGSATGGSATGGSATGGSATGGSATGGGATGGGATGGGATGGSATGGGATGGGATGGGTGGAFDAGLDPDAGTVRFVAVGDTGKGNSEQTAVGVAMGTVCASLGCDFAVLLGDNFYPSGVTSTTDPQWNTAFVQPYASVNIPFYAVLGNHDYGGNGAGTDFTLPPNEVAYSQVNPKWRMPDTHYKWSQGPVDFFAADTNRSMFSQDSKVISDFQAWIPASTAAWKIVFGHHPYYSNGPHGNAGSYDGASWIPIANGKGVKDFLDQTVCGKVDFYICGHDHSRQMLKPTCGTTELIVSGGGASTTNLPGTNPTWWQADTAGFLYVVISGRTLTATFYDAAGVANYTRSVTK